MCNSVFVHWWFTRKQKRCLGWRRRGGLPPIIHSQLGHKAVATLDLVRGSICLTLEMEWKTCYLINKTPELSWGTLPTGAHPTCCPPRLDRLHAGCCSPPPRSWTGCTRRPLYPERRQRAGSSGWWQSNESLWRSDKPDTLALQNSSVSVYLLGPHCRTHIWEHRRSPCCHVTHLQHRQRGSETPAWTGTSKLPPYKCGSEITTEGRFPVIKTQVRGLDWNMSLFQSDVVLPGLSQPAGPHLISRQQAWCVKAGCLTAKPEAAVHP